MTGGARAESSEVGVAELLANEHGGATVSACASCALTELTRSANKPTPATEPVPGPPRRSS